MNKEQIIELAHQYGIDRGVAKCENTCATTMFLDVIEWLLNNYLIVEKDVVQEIYDSNNKAIEVFRLKSYSCCNQMCKNAYDNESMISSRICSVIRTLFRGMFNPIEE